MAQSIEARRARQREYMRDFRARNPLLIKERERLWREAHPDYGKEKARAWRAANPEKSRKSAMDSYRKNIKNRKAARDANREAIRQRGKAWRRANLEKDAAKSRRRYARKRGAVGSHSLAEFYFVCEMHSWQCAYCRCSLCKKTVTEDHVVPISKGGSDFIENMAPACLTCNVRKKDRPAQEFLAMLASEKAEALN